MKFSQTNIKLHIELLTSFVVVVLIMCTNLLVSVGR